MKNLEVRLDSKGNLAVVCNKMFKRELKRLLQDISDDARMLVLANNNRTGALRRSIKPGPIKNVNQYSITGTVTAGSRLAPYAFYVHNGFGQAANGGEKHIIKPTGGRKTLMWLGKERIKVRKVTHGKTLGTRRFGKPGQRRGYKEHFVGYDTVETSNFQKVFPRWVEHPGYKGHPFLWRAAAKNVDQNLGKVKLPSGGPRPSPRVSSTRR